MATVDLGRVEVGRVTLASSLGGSTVVVVVAGTVLGAEGKAVGLPGA